MVRYRLKLKKKLKKLDTWSYWHKAYVAPPSPLPLLAIYILANRGSILEIL